MNRTITPKILGAVLLLCLATEGRSQHANDRPERFWLSGLGTLGIQLRDEHMSPMTYHGSVINPEIGYIKIRRRSISELTLTPSIGSIASKNGTDQRPMRGDYYRLDIQYRYLRSMGTILDDRWRFYLGGQFHFHGNVRLNEQLDTSFITFIFSNGLGVSTAFERSAQLFSRDVIFRYKLGLPLVQHVIRPNFLNIYNYLDPENDWLNERMRDSDVLLPNRLFSINSALEMWYPIRSGNYLRFAYGWEYYSLNHKLNARAASHRVSFAFLFNF